MLAEKSIRTAGELRGFLADVLLGIRAGNIDVDEANAISKVAAQINQSLAVEVKTAIELQKLGKGDHVAGSMQIANGNPALAAPDEGKWCEQCEKRVGPEKIAACGSKFCKLRGTIK